MEESEVEGGGELPDGSELVLVSQGYSDEAMSALSSPVSTDISGKVNDSNPREEGKTKSLDVITCDSCNTELYLHRHKFCFECGKRIEDIISSIPKSDENNSSGNVLSARTSSEQHITKVVVTAGNTTPVEGAVGGKDDNVKDSLKQLHTVDDFDKIAGPEHEREANLEMAKNSSARESSTEQESVCKTTGTSAGEDVITASPQALGTAPGDSKIMKSEEHEREENFKMAENSSAGGNTAEQESVCKVTSGGADCHVITESLQASGTAPGVSKITKSEELEREENFDMAKNSSAGENTTKQESVCKPTSAVADDKVITESPQVLETASDVSEKTKTDLQKGNVQLTGNLSANDDTGSTKPNISVSSEGVQDTSSVDTTGAGDGFTMGIDNDEKDIDRQNLVENVKNVTDERKIQSENDEKPEQNNHREAGDDENSIKMAELSKVFSDPEADVDGKCVKEQLDEPANVMESEKRGSDDPAKAVSKVHEDGRKDNDGSITEEEKRKTDGDTPDHSSSGDGVSPGHSSSSVTPGHSSSSDGDTPGQSCSNDGVTTGHSSSSDGITTGQSSSNDGVTTGHSSSSDGDTPGRASSSDGVTPGHSSTNDGVTPGHSITNDGVTPGHSSSSDGKKTLKSVAAGGNEPLSSETGDGTMGSDSSGYWYKKDNSNDSTSESRGGEKRIQTRSQTSTSNDSVEKKCITVVFHAILSEKFQKTNVSRIFIRGDNPIFRGWDNNAVEIMPVKTLENNSLLLRGSYFVPLQFAHRSVKYKYWLVGNGNADFEELIEFRSRFPGKITDRWFFIPKEFAKENSTYVKYDGFVYPHPGALRGIFSYSLQVNDRRVFFKECFPKWKGFHTITNDCNLPPIKAVEQLDSLVEDALYVWTCSSYAIKNSLPSNELELSKVILHCLTPKISENARLLSSNTADKKSIVDAVFSTVVIMHVFSRHGVQLTDGQLERLFKCLRLPDDKAICDELLDEMNQFQDVLSTVAQSLCKFYNLRYFSKSLIISWLHALPLLHFINGDSKPFVDNEIAKTIDYNNWRWWGLSNINVREFRRHIMIRDVDELLKELSGLFKMDRLLPRSFLLLSPIEVYGDLLRTGHFSVLEVCASLRKMLPDENTGAFTKEFKNDLANLFCEVNAKLSELRVDASIGKILTENEQTILLQTFVKLLYSFRQNLALSDIGIHCRLIESLITAIGLPFDGPEHANPDEKNISAKDIPDKLLTFLKQACGIVNSFFEEKRPPNLKYCTEVDVKNELQAWNKLLSVTAPDIFTGYWHNIFQNRLQDRIRKVDPMRAIEIFCQSDEQNCHPEVAKCLSDTAFKAVDEIVKPGQGGQQRAFGFLTDNPSRKCVDLLTRMLQKAWPQDVPDEDIDDALLKHLLTWPTWPVFLQFFGSRLNSKVILNEDGRIIITTAESRIEHLVHSVQNGSLTVDTLEVLGKHTKQFISLGEIFQRQSKTDEKSSGCRKPIRISFERLIHELIAFKSQRDRLVHFVGICDSFVSVDENFAGLRAKLEEDISYRPICDLCRTTASGIVVVFFNLEPGFDEMVSKICDIQTSRIFLYLWKRYSNKLESETVTMEIILHSIWEPVYEKLMSINQVFLSGEMEIKKVDKYLKMFQQDYGEFQKEFELLMSFFESKKASKRKMKDQLVARIQQVKDYQKLFNAGLAARSILELRSAMNLTGDFSEVESIAEIIRGEFSTNAINSVSIGLLNTGKSLEKITPLRFGCLRTFSNCLDLVEWLKENIGGQQELKVFVDLAMISAGESDMEIDRISFMHTSCLGFGSLIFGLKPEHGFQELMSLCEPVWQAVDANQNLAEQFENTKDQLSWLNQIKDSHGSVALTTLMQVEEINTSGVYHIADLEEVKKSRRTKRNTCEDDEVCLENAICLVVPPDGEKNREGRVYSLEEVKDVQSKLMLIAGKAESGKEEVNQFVEVFEGVLRVGCLYVQLCDVGEINYLTWNKKFQCSKIGGRRDRLLEEINDTCSQMDEHLQEWKKQIDDNRKYSYLVNHFTMKQILKLRKELASASTGQIASDKLPLQIFMLLESVCKDVDGVIVADVLQAVLPDSKVFITEQGLSDDNNYFGVDELITGSKVEVETLPRIPKRKNSLESFNDARETLQGIGYGEDVIIASLRACGRGASENDLIMWVVENDNDLETIELLYGEALEDPELLDHLEDIVGMDCIQSESVGDEHEENVVVACKSDLQIKRKYVPGPFQSFVKNKDDTYLTLPALVSVLEKLAHSESVACVASARKCSKHLKEGEPNLLLVPKGEVFACILTLFMGDGDQALPTDEEVIICDEKTTAEEIELLWRRAVVDNSGLLFCLANADLLDYDVSQQAVRALEHITQGESSFRLVVICSIENEDKSNMVASFDQYRRRFPPITSVKNVQSYLKKRLEATVSKRTIGGVQWQPAAMIDKENLSVRVVQSFRAGVGKSLVVKRLTKQLEKLSNNKRLRRELVPSLCQTVPVHGVSADSDEVTRALSPHAMKPDIPISRIFHLDISQSVGRGLDTLLFKLLILSTIKDSSGNVWRRKATDMYVIEMTTDKTFAILTSDESLSSYDLQSVRKATATTKYSFLRFLPRIMCLTPREALLNLQLKRKGDTEFDMEKFHSVEYQRTYQYLKLFNEGHNLDNFTFQYQQHVAGDLSEALKIIIKYCGIRDPSWAELHHFVNFLNSQLRDCEESIFCNTELVGDLLQGFRTFVVRFLIQMSRDFATRSLSDTSNLTANEDEMGEDADDDLAPFQIRRRWEKSPHPYIFFNKDRHSMTFLGFLLSANGDLLNPVNNEVLEGRLMDPTLRGQLKVQGVDFDKNYEVWDRLTRITNLCRVMGVENMYDPDSTYELTTDNVEKILAIHMRFRCGIPVIIMGETGCGKTRLIRFMCELQAGPGGPKNMLLMKVHGGTGYKDIERKVKEAEELASKNNQKNIDTVLFFDEANTTDAIDLIKEVMVDCRVNGRPIYPALYRLHFIAACNPYRKHTEKMIHKLESAGLGYHVSAEETDDKLGSIPLRQLVYRVHPLPESMRPLVWDFGQLTDHTEELYTRQIVRRFFSNITPSVNVQANVRPVTISRPSTSQQQVTVVQRIQRTDSIDGDDAQASCIARVLSASQKYMRAQNNECSFVSLRDVERAMKVITWFYVNSDIISNAVDKPESHRDDESSEEDSDDEEMTEETAELQQPLNKIVRALVLGIGVSYYARLNDRTRYCADIVRHFTGPCSLYGGSERMKREILRCQYAFLDNITLGHNIARNTALSENVFMMAICTEMRIPLFVVGKPGSSKSLAKDVISTHMKANASQSELFKRLKEIHMQSYQCSPLSTPDGIVSTFRQCSKLQQGKDLKKFVSVVVLDEIGLAEDSPLMPLKALHPLLEDGTATEEDSSAGKPSEHLRVGFIGLSNWALDPAKMNRGIMLSRGVPTMEELITSAMGICSSDLHIQHRIAPIINKLAEGYEHLYEYQKRSKTLKKAKKEEFFGLRDFYSLVKMVYGFAADSDDQYVSCLQLEQAIKRNFSGLDDLNPIKLFSQILPQLKPCAKYPSPESDAVTLIDQSLNRTSAEGESRYLLVLTENYAALTILQQQFLSGQAHDPVVIFGSSFPKDQHYTQICRNINRIKVCMETGRMVILLNLESLYESLYDALNQYYLYLAGQKYVDLGLGSHRVKCRVADNFKLIVVAEKDDVYQRFPIPLINRLEKHFLIMSTSLTPHQEQLVKELDEWVKRFSNAKQDVSQEESSFVPGDSFVGYHSDTAAAVILKVTKYKADVQEILNESKFTLLQCASPDAIARLSATELSHHADEIWDIYFNNQKHKSLLDFLEHTLRATEQQEDDEGFLAQITTHSRLLSQSNVKMIAKAAGFPGSRSRCISLQEFHTEQQFTKTIQEFFLQLGGSEGLLMVQCDNGEANFNLIACCRYLVVETRRRSLEDAPGPVKPTHIFFLIQLPKIAGGCQKFVGFQGGKWTSFHIDELLESNEQLPQIDQLVNRSVSGLFKPANSARSNNDDAMDVDNGELEAKDENIESRDSSSVGAFNPTLILRNCLQAAAARVFDDSANVNRATRRIEILSSLLPEDSSETDFSRILVRRVHQLLHQRDESLAWQDQKLWLHREALCRGRLQETGTFRKALWQKLSSIVSPMLSEVIAFSDCNENLNFVEGEISWKSKLWYAMLNKEEITPLNYDSLISPVSRALRERARVVGTGAGHHFQCRFPFSWLIKDTVNKLLLKVQGNTTGTSVLNLLRGVIDSSPFGDLFNALLEDRDVKEFAMLEYLHDFVHMSYKPTVDDEMELVFDAIISTARGIHQSLHLNEGFSLDIALIHIAYSLTQARLSCFSGLVDAFPNVVQKVLKQSQILNGCEMILDVVTLEHCLRELEPTRVELEKGEARLVWCSRVQSVRPTMQVMTRLFAERSPNESHAKLDTQLDDIGEVSMRTMSHCRLCFTRLSVVRLFIEHTYRAEENIHPDNSQNAFRLWKILGERPDFSTVETMVVVERFLKECSDSVTQRYFKYDEGRCGVCARPLEDPVEIPCEHICCKACATIWFADNNSCPVCRQEVGENFNIVVSDKYRNAVEDRNTFRNRCKSFFMELVAIYCFGEESRQLPSPDLVRKFIGYVIKENNKTEDFTPFDGQGIDTTPVVRSFILQQLLAHKGRGNPVRQHLEEYLRLASGLVDQRDHMIEVCVLCVQCMEDTETTKLLKCKEASDNNQIAMATRMLENSLRVLAGDMRTSAPTVINVTSLQTVATTRAALEVLSTYLTENYATDVERYDNLQTLLQATRNLCVRDNRSPIRLFLLKQLVRKYGIDTIKEMCKQNNLQWILPAPVQQQQRNPDSFIVHQENYHTIREALAKAILSCSTDELDQMFQRLVAIPAAQDVYFLLALFREITTRYATDNTQERISDMVLQKINKFIAETRHLSTALKEFASKIVMNSNNETVAILRVTAGQTGNERRLAEVLVHFRIILECCHQNPLLEPLRNLAVNPARMLNAFLPTMPHDYGVEAMQASLTEATWYECPNGHRYVITECGRPTQHYTCPDCNAPIGGENHALVTGNATASGVDRTSNGHIIGSAGDKPLSLASERNLTPLACGILRFLTHGAMLLGADHDSQNVLALVKPQVTDVVQFLLEHLQHDIRCLARTTGNNYEDAMQIIHLVLAGILEIQQVDLRIDGSLYNKQSRNAWEDTFMSTYLNPVLSTLSQQLQDSFDRMGRDERIGSDPLMRQLYELDTPNYDTMANIDPMCPALWRYRTRVSVEHLSIKFQEYVGGLGGSRCNTLKAFLEKEHLLRALQYLPDIVKFQRQLSEKFHRRLDRSESDRFTLADFLKEAPQMRKQLDALVSSFRMAWKLTRSYLSQNGRLSIPPELCALEVTNRSPISMFLPSNTGHGRCALGLTSFLVTLHNEFIGRCKTLLGDESSSPDVPLINVTKAHLVAYDTENDLLPMILAQCDYSLKVGEGTVVDYNWEGLERQLVDRFIRGRSRLTSMIELFVFSKDICDGEVFATLKQKIPQVELSRPVQEQINNELNQLTDICDVLRSIQIAIGFLASAGGRPDMLVSEYLENALKMSNEEGLKSSKAQQSCQIRHIISLWRLLSLERARLLTNHKQDPFDSISDTVKTQLNGNQTFELSRGLQKFNLDLFIRELLEVILLYLKHVPKEQLHWPLSQYLNAKREYDGSDPNEDLNQYIPDDILLEHAVETWKIACQKIEDHNERMPS